MARALVVLLAYRVQSRFLTGDAEAVVHENRGDVVGHGRHPLGVRLLLPPFAHHNRAAHAERHALLRLLAELLGAKRTGASASDADMMVMSGDVWLFATHTPCISCLAVFCQFRRLLPGVRLHISFLEWRRTRKQVLESSASTPPGSASQ